jgi:hypothetical protein
VPIKGGAMIKIFECATLGCNATPLNGYDHSFLNQAAGVPDNLKSMCCNDCAQQIHAREVNRALQSKTPRA